MKTILVALVAIAAAACGSGPVDVSLTDDMTPQERAAVARAAEAWNGIALDHVSVDGGRWRIVRGHPPAGYVGWTDAPDHLITIDRTVSDDVFYETVLHELGHALGLRHIAERGVMNPDVGATSFSSADIEECRLAGACR